MPAHLITSLAVSGFGPSAASGTVSFYSPGTLVSQPVYSDDTLSTIYTQPITLDASGRTSLPVYTATPLRAIIKSVAGSTLADYARIDGSRAELVGVSNAAFPGATSLDGVLTLLGSSTGGTNGQFLDGGAGAVSRTILSKFNEVQISVKDYGAVGNGIADDTTAIQAAINRAMALGGGKVFVPAGTFLVSSALSISGSSPIALVGQSQVSSTIKNTNATGNVMAITGGGSDVISDLTLTASGSTGTAIADTSSGGCVFRYLTISAHTNGISSSNVASIYSVSYAPKTPGSGTGFALAAPQSVISGCFIASPPAVGIDLSGGGAGFGLVSGGVISGAVAVRVRTGVSVLLSSVDLSLATTSIQIDSGAVAVEYSTSSLSATNGVADTRTGAPVAYSFGTSQALTPLPGAASVIRVVATAAMTVTLNAVTPMGFGRTWTMICSNASGGAVVWSFAAQYVLSAAVAPSTGNRVNLILTYDPVSGKVYEIGRAATAN